MAVAVSLEYLFTLQSHFLWSTGLGRRENLHFLFTRHASSTLLEYWHVSTAGARSLGLASSPAFLGAGSARVAFMVGCCGTRRTTGRFAFESSRLFTPYTGNGRTAAPNYPTTHFRGAGGGPTRTATVLYASMAGDLLQCICTQETTAIVSYLFQCIHATRGCYAGIGKALYTNETQGTVKYRLGWWCLWIGVNWDFWNTGRVFENKKQSRNPLI